MMTLDNSVSWSRSSGRPSPRVIRSRIVSNCWVPSRHGVHLPHDSSAVNSRKNLATSTMQLVSSIPTMPPEPTIAPVLTTDS
jgi:hypothetical protein